MPLARARRAALLALLTLACANALIYGCSSSDKPPYASTTGDGAGNGEASPRADGPLADQDAGANDATDAPFVNGPCLDDKPAPLDGGAPDCGASATCGSFCTRILDHYKLGVAQTAISCFLALPSCGNANDVRTCVDKALGNVCADPTADGYCTGIVKKCDPNAGGAGSNIDQKGCVDIANGLTGSGRTTFLGCLQSKIEAGTCPAEVVTCADEIRQ